MALPSPDDYASWQEFARALIGALGNGEAASEILGSNANATAPSIPGHNLPPVGFAPVWLNEAEATLWLGNAAFSPPDAPDLFMIDTTNLALAAVTLANMAAGSVGTVQIQAAAIGTAQIGNGAILSALIGDAQIVTAKVSDLAVNSAKIADAAISSAKIANLAVGVAHIQDASITNAKIAGVIQSNSWNDSTKAGWKLDKDGSIQGRALTIYDSTGAAIFNAGGSLDLSRVAGAGALAGLNILALSGGQLTGFGTLAALSALDLTSPQLTGFGALAALNSLGLGSAQLTGFGTLAGLNSLGLGSGYLTGFGSLASQSSITSSSQLASGVVTDSQLAAGAVVYGTASTVGFGTLAAVSLLTAGNITTYISGAAIGSALIANAAIGTAHINAAAITTALIADAAIVNAKIADATILSAKIASLVVNKLSSGQLDATIDVGTGALVFTIGGNKLVLGRGFGTTSQFFLWFGPSMALSAMSEVNGTVWFRTDGDAYFGGSLTAGVLTNAVSSPSTADTASVETAVFGSNGGTITVVFSWTMSTTRTDTYAATSGGLTAFNAAATAVGAVEEPAGSGEWFATNSVAVGAEVELFRSISGGSYALASSFTVAAGTENWQGTEPIVGDSPGSSTITRSWGGSATYTDPTNSTADRQYLAGLASRDAVFLAGPGPHTQRLSLTTVEE